MVRSKRSKSTLTKKQRSEVRKIANKAMDAQEEDKAFVFTKENIQLLHNKPDYHANFLGDIQQGTQTGSRLLVYFSWGLLFHS